MSFLILFINILFNIIIVALFIRIILSWFRVSPENFFIGLIIDITNPLLLPFQRIIPPVGMLDFSPIAAFITLEILRKLLIFGIKFVF